jgi:hypothetical protein
LNLSLVVPSNRSLQSLLWPSHRALQSLQSLARSSEYLRVCRGVSVLEGARSRSGGKSRGPSAGPKPLELSRWELRAKAYCSWEVSLAGAFIIAGLLKPIDRGPANFARGLRHGHFSNHPAIWSARHLHSGGRFIELRPLATRPVPEEPKAVPAPRIFARGCCGRAGPLLSRSSRRIHCSEH